MSTTTAQPDLDLKYDVYSLPQQGRVFANPKLDEDEAAMAIETWKMWPEANPELTRPITVQNSIILKCGVPSVTVWRFAPGEKAMCHFVAG